MEFVVHLHRTGVLEAEDVVRVLDAQVRSQPLIGRVALQSRALSADQVAAILAAQADGTARRAFGEIAVELGFLTPERLATLLAAQREAVTPAARVIVSLGLLTEAEVGTLLELWRRAN